MERLLEAAGREMDGLISFAQRLIRTPSLSGQEAAVAVLVEAEMRSLGYDEVTRDAAGNVIGVMRGRGEGGTVMLNGHMDHVDPGPPEAWEYPPYEGVVAEGRLHGRGAADMKGSLAAQVYSVAVLRRAGMLPAGDVLVTTVVHEETGGLGTQMLLADGVRADWAVVGEASGLQLRRGHRGRLEVLVTAKGRSVHASAPERGANPHFTIARFVDRLREVPLPSDADFRGSSVAPTLIVGDNKAGNVTPSRLVLHLDYRTVPGETEESMIAAWQALLDQCLTDGCTGEVEIETGVMTCYTGLTKTLPNVFPAYRLAADDPLVKRADSALTATFGSRPEVGVWRFSTDGGHLMRAGIPTIGYGPGEEHLVHTNRESIALAELKQAAAGYASLCLALSQA